jgi:hypothetical protein
MNPNACEKLWGTAGQCGSSHRTSPALMYPCLLPSPVHYRSLHTRLGVPFLHVSRMRPSCATSAPAYALSCHFLPIFASLILSLPVVDIQHIYLTRYALFLRHLTQHVVLKPSQIHIAQTHSHLFDARLVGPSLLLRVFTRLLLWTVHMPAFTLRYNCATRDWTVYRHGRSVFIGTIRQCEEYLDFAEYRSQSGNAPVTAARSPHTATQDERSAPTESARSEKGHLTSDQTLRGLLDDDTGCLLATELTLLSLLTFSLALCSALLLTHVLPSTAHPEAQETRPSSHIPSAQPSSLAHNEVSICGRP